MHTTLYLGNPHTGYVTDSMSNIPAALANFNQETREIFVTDLAAISRGNTSSKNPTGRFRALLKEAAPNLTGDTKNKDFQGNASRPMEFCPIVITFIKLYIEDIQDVGYFILPSKDQWKIDFTKVTKLKDYTGDKSVYISKADFYNNIARFSYMDNKVNHEHPEHIITLHSNLRCLVNAGIPYGKIPFIESILYKITKQGEEKFICVNGEKIDLDDLNWPKQWIKSEDESQEYFLIYTKYLKELGIEFDTVLFDYKQGNLEIPYYDDFKAISMKIPMFVWAQFPMTHTMLSKESQSDRVSEETGHWLPEDLIKRLNKFKEKISTDFSVTDQNQLFRVNIFSYIDNDDNTENWYYDIGEHTNPISVDKDAKKVTMLDELLKGREFRLLKDMSGDLFFQLSLEDIKRHYETDISDDELVKNIEWEIQHKNLYPILDMKNTEDIENLVDLFRSAYTQEQLIDLFYHRMLTCWSQTEVQTILQQLDYKREIWSRAPYYFKYKKCVVTGWRNDPNTWEHAFLERSVQPDDWKNWTQSETKAVVEIVKKTIDA